MAFAEKRSLHCGLPLHRSTARHRASQCLSCSRIQRSCRKPWPWKIELRRTPKHFYRGDHFRTGHSSSVRQSTVLPDELWIAWSGAALTLLGVLFAIWARFTIGKEWSAEVQIKEGHQLIRNGPYAHIRHPIYTGILLALCGTAMAIGEYRAILGVVLFLVGFIRKAKKEERFLAGEFGLAFDEHRRRTGFFLPRVT